MNIGDQVICIDGGNWTEQALLLIPNRPKEDKLYTIRDVALTRNGKALLLEEIENPLVPHPSGMGLFEPNFNANRFRKIDEEKQSIGFHVSEKKRTTA